MLSRWPLAAPLILGVGGCAVPAAAQVHLMVGSRPTGICSVPRPCLSAASEGLTQPREYSSTESSQGVAARDTRPGADEPLSGHLRLRILPSHESIPEALMPKLRIGADRPPGVEWWRMLFSGTERASLPCVMEEGSAAT